MVERALLGALACLLALIMCSCKPESTPETLLNASIVRKENGRVIVVGRTALPDSTWIYIETVADPEGFNGVAAEAFPVESGIFTAVTPFTAPLEYRADIVLSPALNPDLGDFLSAQPENPGSIMRRAHDGAEMIFRVKATFGSDADRKRFTGEILGEAEKNLKILSKDYRAMQNDDWLSKMPAMLKRYNADAPQRLYIYAPTLANHLVKTRMELDSLYKLHLKSLKGSTDHKEAMKKSVLNIRRRLDQAAKSIQEMKDKTDRR